MFSPHRSTDKGDLLTDYVQMQRRGDVCELKGMVFPASDFANTDTHANVGLKVVESSRIITDGQCSLCPNSGEDFFFARHVTVTKYLLPIGACAHIVAFTFWLLNKSTERNPSAVVEFWGHELETLVQPEPVVATRICDMIPKDEVRLESEQSMQQMSASEGQAFLDAVLEELSACGRDSALYRQCVDISDEFEPLFIHHVLLRAAEHNILDVPSFVHYMELQAQTGIFESLNEVTRNQYKSKLWIESQYMRIRCSMMHMIVNRKSAEEDEQIFNMMFCKGRDTNTDDRVQQKQHKRFILKQTEKLENKQYLECGLLLDESYPFLCAAPDGITDDHIVEIKSPKTEEDFEKYLEARESIAPKYMAQIQIQMFMANVKKALYCVLSPTFDTNGALHYVWVQADPEFVSSLLTMAEDFWRDAVFPRLTNIYPQLG